MRRARKEESISAGRRETAAGGLPPEGETLRVSAGGERRTACRRRDLRARRRRRGWDPSPRGARAAEGGKAPFTGGTMVPLLLLIPLMILLFISFHVDPSPAAAGEGVPSFRWPARGELLTPFRPARGPYGAGGHSGIDIALPVGSRVAASASGRVSFAGRTPVGLCVSIVHGGGFKTTYVSLASCGVRRGERVEAGDFLGTSDGTGDPSSSSPHLHFGLFLGGRPVDPLPFLRDGFADPRECLFLGPWEDRGAVDGYFERQRRGGLFQALGRAFSSAAKRTGSFFKAAFDAAKGLIAEAWDATAGAFKAAYRVAFKPWLEPAARAVGRFIRAVLSNRFVQALLAGLCAAAAVVGLVLGAAVVLGLSAAATVVAAVVGALAAVGYALYYASAAGDSFTFGGCFVAALTVGSAAAAAVAALAVIVPSVAVGWWELGLLGVGKSFLLNGLADTGLYVVFTILSGGRVTPAGILLSFFLGGLAGSLGKMFVTGLFGGGAVRAAAAGFISSGGMGMAGSLGAGVSAAASAIGSVLVERISYVFLSGCVGFLGDVLFRALLGTTPSILESLLSFSLGALAGGIGLAAEGEGLAGLLSRLSRGRLRIRSEWTRMMLGKLFNRGVKEGLSELVDEMEER